MAIGFMKTAREAGLNCPRDFSVVGFDGIEFADYCEPTLTTIRQPRDQLGRRARAAEGFAIGSATEEGPDPVPGRIADPRQHRACARGEAGVICGGGRRVTRFAR
jgi:Periplasmic binding protein-like domain